MRPSQRDEEEESSGQNVPPTFRGGVDGVPLGG